MSRIRSGTLIDPLEDRLVSAFPTSGNFPGRVVIHSGLADMFFYCDGTEMEPILKRVDECLRSDQAHPTPPSRLSQAAKYGSSRGATM